MSSLLSIHDSFRKKKIIFYISVSNPFFFVQIKNHFHKKRFPKKNNFLSFSISAVRISTVLKISRLPGFLGLIPPPALDKRLLYFNSYNFTWIMSCSLIIVNKFLIILILETLYKKVNLSTIISLYRIFFTSTLFID